MAEYAEPAIGQREASLIERGRDVAAPGSAGNQQLTGSRECLCEDGEWRKPEVPQGTPRKERVSQTTPR